MRAMILAAGFGTRLWPLTIDRAKAAIPFMGRPLVGYMAEYLAGFGCKEIVVNLHHRGESVREALGSGDEFGARFIYVEEPEILGTSGALDNAKEHLEGGTFIVANGKLATNIDLGAALATHRRTGALATLVLRRNMERDRYSTVEVSAERILGFGNFPDRESASDKATGTDELTSAPLMYTGIQILEPRIFEYIPRGVFSHSVTDVWLPAIAKGEAIVAHIGEGYWYELSTVKRYLETSLELMAREGRGVETGKGTQISEHASVSQSVLWDNVSVEAGATVERAILGDGVSVRAGETIRNSAVVRTELVEGSERPPKGLVGEVHGENFVAPLTQ